MVLAETIVEKRLTVGCCEISVMGAHHLKKMHVFGKVSLKLVILYS